MAANNDGELKYSWQQTMLRIKDPKVTVPFYQNLFSMKLLDIYHFPEMQFSLYFLASLPPGVEYNFEPGTEEAHQYLWNFEGTTLELTHNYGTENDPNFTHNNGNVEPHRGFGHIAFYIDDVYKACEALEAQNVKFQKKPDEGRMKGLAFALDPDGYWIEIIKRNENSNLQGYSLAQTMIRVKDPVKSLAFYRDHFKMSVLAEKHFPEAKFSLYFLASLKEGEESLEINQRFNPVLELTHNHGTESDPNFSYHNGNTEPKGFGHIGFLTNDVNRTCDNLEAAGYEFIKKPDSGRIKGIAFVKDPDGYWIEIIPRGFSVVVS